MTGRGVDQSLPNTAELLELPHRAVAHAENAAQASFARGGRRRVRTMQGRLDVNVQEDRQDRETITLHLTRAEAELLEAQLSRDIAHIEDELVESGGSGSVLTTNARDLRYLEGRLRELLASEPTAEIV